MTPVLDLREVHKRYGEGEAAVHALRGVSLAVEAGEHVAIVGPSGSGKSTLMNLIGCLDVPTAGEYRIDGTEVAQLDDRALAIVRNRRIGFVFQSFNLIPRMSARQNVELPLAYAGVRGDERRRRAAAAMDLVGVLDRAEHLPSELSGGQQQRVAVARSLVVSPSIVLADEPTGNLDSRSTADVLSVFDELNALGRTVVVITHEHDVAARARRVIEVRDGLIASDSQPPAGPADRALSEAIA